MWSLHTIVNSSYCPVGFFTAATLVSPFLKCTILLLSFAPACCQLCLKNSLLLFLSLLIPSHRLEFVLRIFFPEKLSHIHLVQIILATLCSINQLSLQLNSWVIVCSVIILYTKMQPHCAYLSCLLLNSQYPVR